MMLDLSLITAAWPQLAMGAALTFGITAASFAGALVVGLPLTVGRVGRHPSLRRMADAYVSLFRVVPELALIFWCYYCLPLLLDFALSEITCGIIALTAVAAAYVSEVYRAGYNALPLGQFEAARALGLSDWQAWRLILFPQILRRVTPSLINCGIDTLKNSTLLAAIGATELAYEAYQIGNRTYDYLTPFTVVAIVFFAIIFPLSLFARFREFEMRAHRR